MLMRAFTMRIAQSLKVVREEVKRGMQEMHFQRYSTSHYFITPAFYEWAHGSFELCDYHEYFLTYTNEFHATNTSSFSFVGNDASRITLLLCGSIKPSASNLPSGIVPLNLFSNYWKPVPWRCIPSTEFFKPSLMWRGGRCTFWGSVSAECSRCIF